MVDGTGSDGGWMVLVLEGIRRAGLMVDGMVGAVGGDSGVASPGLARKNATREN